MAPKSLADIFYLYRYNISRKKKQEQEQQEQALTPPLRSATQRLLTVVRALGVWSLNLAWLGGNLKRKCLVFPSKYKRVFL